MKKFTGAFSTVIVLAIVSACTTDPRMENNLPRSIVKKVQKGMTAKQVQQIAGLPAAEITMQHTQGMCQTYVSGDRDGQQQIYFVSYNEAGQVMNYGFQSCKDYDSTPP
ncbi:osmotically-inducible lipoprotein OsmE [Enterobacteriaceae bacterium LUAb1]